jgi:hypothetical protein
LLLPCPTAGGLPNFPPLPLPHLPNGHAVPLAIFALLKKVPHLPAQLEPKKLFVKLGYLPRFEVKKPDDLPLTVPRIVFVEFVKRIAGLPIVRIARLKLGEIL